MRTRLVYVAAAILVIAAYWFIRNDGRKPPGPKESNWEALDECRFGFYTDCTEITINPCSQSAREPGLFKDRTMTVSMAPSIKTEYWEARITPDPLPQDFARYRVSFFSIPPSGECDTYVPHALLAPAQFFHWETGLDGVGISTDCKIAFIVDGVKGDSRKHSVRFIDPNRAFVVSNTGALVNPLGESAPCDAVPGVARGIFFSPDMSLGVVVGWESEPSTTMWCVFYDIDGCPDTPPHTPNGKIPSGSFEVPVGPTISLEMSDPGPMGKRANEVVIRVSGKPDTIQKTLVP